MLAHFDALPNGSLGSLTSLELHRADGTHHTAAGAVDLGNAQGHSLADHLAKLGAAGHTALGSGHEHAHALHVHHDAALVLLSDLALQGGLVLASLFDVLPHLHGVQTLLGEHSVALHVIHADDVGLDLVAHLHHVFGLHVGISAQLIHGDIAGLLAAQIDLDLGGANCRHDTGYLLSCI